MASLSSASTRDSADARAALAAPIAAATPATRPARTVRTTAPVPNPSTASDWTPAARASMPASAPASVPASIGASRRTDSDLSPKDSWERYLAHAYSLAGISDVPAAPPAPA